MSVDRSKAPPVNKITHLDLSHIESENLPNGADIYFINAVNAPLIQISIYFLGGRFFEIKKGVSRATSILLKEGTRSRSGKIIAEAIDFYGANLSTGASLDYNFIRAFSLSKYFDHILPILRDLLFEPIFPEDELQKYIVNACQQLDVSNSKSEVVAYKKLTEKLFGNDHPYGYNSTKSIYRDLTREDLVKYHQKHLLQSPPKVIVSGMISEDHKTKIISLVDSLAVNTSTYIYPSSEIHYPNKRINIPIKEKQQSAIKIGKKISNRKHPDFFDLYITNTILGGFFGSRLMKSIREDKGYTYSIYSSLDMHIHEGYINIGSEVNNQYADLTIKAIYDEMHRMRNERVPNSELDMVKRYLSGTLLNMTDGPFRMEGLVKVCMLNNMPIDFYNQLMHRVQNIQPDDILNISKKYFNPDDFLEVVVG